MIFDKSLAWFQLCRLEATDNPGLRYAICAIATELCKSESGLVRLRDINFAQALERLRQKKIAKVSAQFLTLTTFVVTRINYTNYESTRKDPALEMIMDFLAAELRPKIT